jgi:hypothetical protein
MSTALELFANTAVTRAPSVRTSVTMHALRNLTMPFESARIVGSLVMNQTTALQNCMFRCHFGSHVFAFLHVGGHLVCQSGAYSRLGSTSGVDNPLNMRYRPTPWALRLTVVSLPSPKSTPAGQNIGLAVTCLAPGHHGTLMPTLSEAEQRHDMLQQRLAQGWGLWLSSSYLTHVLLPEGIGLNLALCDLLSHHCVTRAR